MLVITLASFALAAEPEPTAPTEEATEAPTEKGPGLLAERYAPPGVWLAIRGVGEMWHDPYIGTRFGTGGVVAGLGMVVPVKGLLALDAEVAYHRRVATTGEGTLQLAPFALLAVARLLPSEASGIELFGGLGPAIVMWSESGQSADYMEGLAEDPSAPTAGVLRGARPGLEVRLGARIDLGLVQPSLNPNMTDPVQGVSLEVAAGRRFHTNSSGFNLNTWRVGAGLAIRF